MATTRQPNAEDGSLGRDLLYALRYYLGRRRSLLLLAAVALAGGLAFNWSWLAAAGIAPLILSVLPCVAMCALGLCMNRMTGHACTSDQAASTAAAADGTELPDMPSDDALTNDAATDAQAANVPAAAQFSQPQTTKERNATDA